MSPSSVVLLISSFYSVYIQQMLRVVCYHGYQVMLWRRTVKHEAGTEACVDGMYTSRSYVWSKYYVITFENNY